MKILFCVDILDKSKPIEECLDLACWLISQGHQVWIAGKQGNLGEKTELAGCGRVMVRNWQDCHFIYHELLELAQKEKFDRVHLFSFYTYFPGYLVAKELKIPYFISVFDLTYFAYWQAFRWKSVFLKDYLLKEASCVFVPSSEIKEKLYKLRWVSLNQCEVIFPWARFVSNQKSRDLNVNSLQMLYVGRLDQDQKKAVLGVLRFFLKMKKNFHPEMTLKILGQGEIEKAVEKRLSEINFLLKDKCLFWSSQKKILRREIEASCCFLGRGKIILEALRAEKPVLLVNEQGPLTWIYPDILEQAANGLFSGAGLAAQEPDEIYRNGIDAKVKDLSLISRKIGACFSVDPQYRKILKQYKKPILYK